MKIKDKEKMIFNFAFRKNSAMYRINDNKIRQLEQAGVPESVTADIVGHEKKIITYGLYGGGSSLKQKVEAINKIIYD